MTRALLLMFVAMSLIPAGDAAGKLLTAQGVAPVFVAWTRFLIGALILLPLAAGSGLRLLRDPRVWLRGLLLVGGITLIQTALKTAPLADVFAAFFIGPIISYLLAGWILKEPMTPLRNLAVIGGFVGVLLVTRPGIDMTPGIGFAVLAGICYGGFLAASRWLRDVGSPLQLTLSQLAVGALVLIPLGIGYIPDMDAPTAGLILISAICSMAGNLILLYAYGLAPATTLAPLVYLQLLAAVFLGYVIFADLPDLWTWGGLVLILGAGLLSARSR